MNTMKAVIFTEYGSSDVPRFTVVDKPVPADNEVLVRVCASSVNAAAVPLAALMALHGLRDMGQVPAER